MTAQVNTNFVTLFLFSFVPNYGLFMNYTPEFKKAIALQIANAFRFIVPEDSIRFDLPLKIYQNQILLCEFNAWDLVVCCYYQKRYTTDRHLCLYIQLSYYPGAFVPPIYFDPLLLQPTLVTVYRDPKNSTLAKMNCDLSRTILCSHRTGPFVYIPDGMTEEEAILNKGQCVTLKLKEFSVLRRPLESNEVRGISQIARLLVTVFENLVMSPHEFLCKCLMEMFDEAKTGMIPELTNLAIEYADIMSE